MKYRYVIKITGQGYESFYINRFLSTSYPDMAKHFTAFWARRRAKKLNESGLYHTVEVFPYYK